MLIRKALVLGILLLASAAATAQDYYLGGSLGRGEYDESIASNLISSGSIDGKATAWRIYGGGFFGKHLGAELAYVDLGEASYAGTFFGTPVTGGKASVWGYNVAAVARFALAGRFTVFGKLGVFLWENESSDLTGGAPSAGTLRGWDGGSFGIGAAWRFSGSLSGRLEWERFPIDIAEASLLSLGLQYHF